MRTENRKHTLFPESIAGVVLNLRREPVPPHDAPANYAGQTAKAYRSGFAAGYRGWQAEQHLGFTEPTEALQEALTLGFHAGRKALAKKIGKWFPKPMKGRTPPIQLPGADCAVKNPCMSDPWILRHLDASWSRILGPLPPKACQAHAEAYEAGFNAGYIALGEKQNRYKSEAARSAYGRGFEDGSLALAHESGFLSAHVQMWEN